MGFWSFNKDVSAGTFLTQTGVLKIEFLRWKR